MSAQAQAPKENASCIGISANARLEVKSPNVTYSDDCIESTYMYQTNLVHSKGDMVTVTPHSYKYQFRTQRRVPRTGMMLVGWGGNNGSTITAGILANKLNITWEDKRGTHSANYKGSLTQASTIKIGTDPASGRNVYAPFSSLLPMVNPNDLVIGGWDINGANLAKAMQRAQVLDHDLQRQLVPHMEKLQPMPSIYYPDFIAANQQDRADNLVESNGNKQKDLERIRSDIRQFKKQNKLDTIIVLWTANTERFTDVRKGLNLTADEVLNSIRQNADEVSPSNIFAVASILEGPHYINGSPQNTLVPGVIELASRYGVFVGGDDFKSGQTKMKSVLVDFLVSAGIKPEAIVSYNHLGNNDGKNLSAPEQFRSKEISKSSVVDDMVESNPILYAPNEHPDHCVVIKYVPYVRDSKRAMDEYSSTIFLDGLNTIVMHNTCEDSLLASPLILDLVILTELFSRISYKTEEMQKYEHFHSVLSILSYLLKAPMVPQGTPVVNSLFRQQRCILNVMSACVGLPPDNDMLLEHKTRLPKPVMQAKL